jgi:hypothetical protein
MITFHLVHKRGDHIGMAICEQAFDEDCHRPYEEGISVMYICQACLGLVGSLARAQHKERTARQQEVEG